MANTDLTAEQLRALLHYCPDTGIFTWIGKTSSNVAIGSRAGSHSKIGYITIRVLGHLYYAHRLAWLYMHGDWPQHTIDHIDMDKSNNQFHNLRDVTRQVNYTNKRNAASNNKSSGLLGVSKENSKWQARITVNSKLTRIGLFETKELAHAAYLQAKRQLHAGCTI